MRLRLILCAVFMIMLASCQGQTEKVVLVVTATPAGNGANSAATNTNPPQAATKPPATPIPASPTPSISATPDVRPTATIGQIQVAEEVFEHGRMFWIQPRKQI